MCQCTCNIRTIVAFKAFGTLTRCRPSVANSVIFASRIGIGRVCICGIRSAIERTITAMVGMVRFANARVIFTHPWPITINYTCISAGFQLFRCSNVEIETAQIPRVDRLRERKQREGRDDGCENGCGNGVRHPCCCGFNPMII